MLNVVKSAGLGLSFPDVVIASRDMAADYLASPLYRDKITHLISINESNGEALTRVKAFVKPKVVLYFEDIEVEVPGCVLPEPSDILQIRRLAKEMQGSGGVCLVHCYAGISRSSAAAITALTLAAGKARLRETVEAVFTAAPHVLPNRLMIQYADDRMEAQGELSGLIEEFVQKHNGRGRGVNCAF